MQRSGSVHLRLFPYRDSQQIVSTNSLHALTRISFFTKKIIIKSFRLVLYVLHCSFSIKLFSYEGWIWYLSFRNRHVWGYQVPPSVETGCLSYTRIIFVTKRCSATNMFLSWDMFCARIRLFLKSIATQSQKSSHPTLITASSTISSSILFLCDVILLGWYFWI